jgi:hypothetical protein
MQRGGGGGGVPVNIPPAHSLPPRFVTLLGLGRKEPVCELRASGWALGACGRRAQSSGGVLMQQVPSLLLTGSTAGDTLTGSIQSRRAQFRTCTAASSKGLGRCATGAPAASSRSGCTANRAPRRAPRAGSRETKSTSRKPAAV